MSGGVLDTPVDVDAGGEPDGALDGVLDDALLGSRKLGIDIGPVGEDGRRSGRSTRGCVVVGLSVLDGVSDDGVVNEPEVGLLAEGCVGEPVRLRAVLDLLSPGNKGGIEIESDGRRPNPSVSVVVVDDSVDDDSVVEDSVVEDSVGDDSVDDESVDDESVGVGLSVVVGAPVPRCPLNEIPSGVRSVSVDGVVVVCGVEFGSRMPSSPMVIPATLSNRSPPS